METLASDIDERCIAIKNNVVDRVPLKSAKKSISQDVLHDFVTEFQTFSISVHESVQGLSSVLVDIDEEMWDDLTNFISGVGISGETESQ